MKKGIFITLGIVAGFGALFYVLVHLSIVGRITSWYRSPWHNRDVGGVWNSLHLIGWAYDVIPADSENLAALNRLRMIWPLARILDEGTHYHFQLL